MMKKLMLVCCFVIGATAMSFAQGGGGAGGGGGRAQRSPADQAAQLKTALTLTDAQVAQVTAIYTAEAAKRDSITKAGGDARTALQPIRTADQAKIKALLTPDQAAAYAKMPQRGGGGGGGRQGGGGGGAGGATPPPAQK